MFGRVAVHKQNRPNIFLYISDDHGIDYVGCYGNTAVRTPNTLNANQSQRKKSGR
jgi:N-sulfoglucosamine sulfohydrolase